MARAVTACQCERRQLPTRDPPNETKRARQDAFESDTLTERQRIMYATEDAATIEASLATAALGEVKRADVSAADAEVSAADARVEQCAC